MTLELNELLIISIGFFIVATLYSSIGFGGGSSYLAVLTIFFTSFFIIRSSGLICNIIVVTGSTLIYLKNGHFSFKKFLPFIISSVPMAFVGAIFKMKENIFFILLGAALILSALFLMWQTLRNPNSGEHIKSYPVYVPYLLGAGIGLLSGMVGIGGGIFLAPILNHMKWDKSIKIAALASFFILVNSLAGLTGLIFNDTIKIPIPEIIFLAIAVFLGGQLGIRLSIKKLTGSGIKIITAILVLIIGIRVLLVNGFQL